MKQHSLIIFCLIISSMLIAQERSYSLLVRANLVFPQGDFLDDDVIAEDSFADLGYGGGVEFQYSIGPKGLGIFISGDILVNPVDEDRIKHETPNLYEYRFNDPYINIPIMAGLLYSVQINPTTEFNFKAGGGLNYFQPPDYELIYGWPDTAHISNASVNTFGFKIAGSLIIDLFLIEVTYLNLGEVKFESQAFQPIFTPILENLKQRISMVNFSFGIRL